MQQLLPSPHSKKVASFILCGVKFWHECECNWLPVSTWLCNTSVLVQGLPKENWERLKHPVQGRKVVAKNRCKDIFYFLHFL